jgi:hypothetical protein
VTFPVTHQVVISVSYGISPTGYLPDAVFAYVLATGARWRGPIGKADISMRLPYPATSENVALDKSKPGARIVNGQRIFRELDFALKPDLANAKAKAIKDDIDQEIKANKPKG